MNCPICGNQSRPALVKDGCEYRECSACSFLFHRKAVQSSAETPHRFYDERYWEMERAEARRREYEDCFVRALELIYLSTIRVENVLDFGCGLGITVQLLRDQLGLNAVGVDLSADFAAKPYLHRCELEELASKYPEGFFDAIYSIEVFGISCGYCGGSSNRAARCSSTPRPESTFLHWTLSRVTSTQLVAATSAFIRWKASSASLVASATQPSLWEIASTP
jgi:hypothetical protein